MSHWGSKLAICRALAVLCADMPFEQSITFSAHTTDKVRLTFTSVKKGEKYDDLCVTEVTVL